MDSFASLLGQVAAYGLRADDAARCLVDATIDQFAYEICQKTGLAFAFLTGFKDAVRERVCATRLADLGCCKGRTKAGIPCKKRVLLEYCDAHADQGRLQQAKKMRLEAHASTLRPKAFKGTIVHSRFSAW